MKSRHCCSNPADLDIAISLIVLVSLKFQLHPDVLSTGTRCMDVVWPRWCAIHLIAKYTRLKSQVIGALFNRESSSVRKITTKLLHNEITTNAERKAELFAVEAAYLNAVRSPTRRK